MKKYFVYGTIILLLVALAAAGWRSAAWLFHTTEGVRTIMAAVSRHTPLKISAGKIEGGLWERLRLVDVQLRIESWEARLESLECRLQPRRLLVGMAAFEYLVATGVSMKDNGRQTGKPDLSWPEVPALMSILDISIERLRIEELSYYAPYRNLRGDNISVYGSVLWRHSRFAAKNIIVESPFGRIYGSLEAGFYQPFLLFELRFAPGSRYADLDFFTVRGSFKPGFRPEQLAGDFTVTASSAGKGRMELSGEAGLAPNSFNLRNLSLKQAGRKGAISGNGVIRPGGAPLCSFNLILKELDLQPEVGLATALSGEISLEGAPASYKGRFALANIAKGWRQSSFMGIYRGDEHSIAIADFNASLLSGTIQGTASLDWRQEFSAKALLHGKKIDPAVVAAYWKGVVNFDLSGEMKIVKNGDLRGRITGKLLESRLHDQLLTGEVEARFGGGNLAFEKLTLQGKGFDFRAAGDVASKLSFHARISDLGKLLPDATGTLNLSGWTGLKDKRFFGSLLGGGRNLVAAGFRIGEASLKGFAGRGDDSLRIEAGLNDIFYKGFRIDSVALQLTGTVPDHEISAAIATQKLKLLLLLSGGLQQRLWRGRIVGLSGGDETGKWRLLKPAGAKLGANGLSVTGLVLAGDGAERLEMSCDLTKEPRGGIFGAGWAGLKLARLNVLLPRELSLTGSTRGQMEGRLFADGRIRIQGKTAIVAAEARLEKKLEKVELLISEAGFSWSGEKSGAAPAMVRLSGHAQAEGSVAIGDNKIRLRQGIINFDGTEEGMKGDFRFAPETGGVVKAAFTSQAPLGFSLPRQGEFRADWSDLDIALFGFLLPKNMRATGRLKGAANGAYRPGRPFSLSGNAVLSPPAASGGGKIGFLRREGEMNVNFRSVSLFWDWKDKELSGDLAAHLVDYGSFKGKFRLPVAAGVSPVLDKKAPFFASFTGKFKENGLLSFIFPGLVKESRGEIDANVIFDGSLEKPVSRGKIKLARAGAYLPFSGIEVKDIELSLTLAGELIRIDSFRAVSGPGVINGRAVLRIAGLRVISYEGRIEGKNFQLFYTPELQMRGSPELIFNGVPGKLTLRGKMELPELLIFGPPAGDYASPSPDVVFEGKAENRKESFLPVFDAKVTLTLGDRALVKMKGFNARLAGGVELEFSRSDEITGNGEIRVVKGSYQAYGVALDIVRGRLFYSQGALIDRPALDILALRSIEEVKAGVSIGGVLGAPAVKLYSEPVMSDIDTLSYIVFGHALSTRSSAEQIGILTQAASLLLSRGKVSGIQDKLKKQFGLSTLDIQSKSSGPAGSIGYRKINGEIAPVGAKPGQINDVSDTLVAVGKYLTPQLYLSYGRSLFTGDNIFSLRYNMGKHWQIETVTGTESGVDLYYKIEFR